MRQDNWDALRAVYVQIRSATFCEQVNAYMQHLGWDSSTFEEQTGQSENTYNCVVRGDLISPSKRRAMAFCIGLGLDYRMSIDLLDSVGYTLSPWSETDTAYDYVLLSPNIQGLEDCNGELEARGVKPLRVEEKGSYRKKTA